MKTHTIRFVAASSFLVLLAAVTAHAGSSTRTETDVPFEFTVGGKTLPAGAYAVTEETHGVLRIRSLDHRSSVVTLTTVVQGKSPRNAAVLVFNRYGDRHFLTQAWLGLAGGYELWKSHRELELAHARPQRAPEVISIAAR